MYVIRRVYKTKPGKVWEVAKLLTDICKAYEEVGRNKAQIYIEGDGVPGTSNTVYAQWTQDVIEPTWPSKVPKSVWTNVEKRSELLAEPQSKIEFYDLVTLEKLAERGLA